MQPNPGGGIAPAGFTLPEWEKLSDAAPDHIDNLLVFWIDD